MIYTTECDCCDALTHHIEFDPDDVTYVGDVFCVHLTEEEAMHLHLCLRERVLGLDNARSSAVLSHLEED